jgi:hypothetical protein
MLLRHKPSVEAAKPTTDDRERLVAREIEVSHPQWAVMWGCYTRLFWAFPRFRVARGTIVSSWSPRNLLADMQDVETEFRTSPRVPAYRGAETEFHTSPRLPAYKGAETEFHTSPRVPAYNSPAPAAPLPRRIPLALRSAPPSDYDPSISGPVRPDEFDLEDSDDSDWDWSGSFWPDYPPQTSGPNYR